jgi:hypothetical protein
MDTEMIDVDDQVERMSAELRDELASNDRRTVDPSTVDLRFTHLKHFAMSPEHARNAMVRNYDDSSLAKRIGSGVHALTFGTPKVAVYAKRRAGKEWDAFAKDHAGQCILNEKENARAVAIAASIRRNKVAERVLFSEGTILEQRIDWEWKGRRCRSTPDARNFRTLVELKSCRTADPAWFHRDAIRMAYHASLAWYRRAIKTTTGVDPREVYIIAVEQTAPYVVTPFKLTERALEAGDRLVKTWFDRLLTCEKTQHWPPYTQGIEDFDVIDPDVEVELAMRDDDGARVDPSF